MKPKLIVYYDGLCDMCSREIGWLRKSSGGRTIFEDLHNQNCSAYKLGLGKFQLMRELHGSVGGRVISGLTVFREMYANAGRKNYLAWTGWPIINKFADFGYMLFAKNRSLISRLFSRFFPLTSCRGGGCRLD